MNLARPLNIKKRHWGFRMPKLAQLILVEIEVSGGQCIGRRRELRRYIACAHLGEFCAGVSKPGQYSGLLTERRLTNLSATMPTVRTGQGASVGLDASAPSCTVRKGTSFRVGTACRACRVLPGRPPACRTGTFWNRTHACTWRLWNPAQRASC